MSINRNANSNLQLELLYKKASERFGRVDCVLFLIGVEND